ncbi:MAG: cytochrome c [Chloroflexi bacterium]|nr:cytochrome c [Chloroflexota bacterium]
MIAFPARFTSMFRRRFVLVAGLLSLAALSVSACAVQESNTYPVETFSEMHYSQSFKSQEPPRLAPPAESVVFTPLGGPDQVLTVPDKRERPYDPAVAGNLYRVNCSVCHGVAGLGDGKIVPHLTSKASFYWTTNNDTAYGTPPNLVESAAERLDTRDTMVAFVTAGAIVMPQFGKLLSEEDIRDIVNYIFDDETGLSRSP